MIAEYLARMKKTLPDYAEYEACLALPPYRGVRVNTLKISAEEFQKISPFALEPVAWAQSGFSISEEKPGRTPYHDAGLFYVQEPSAMCAAPLLDARPGERVLDLCSAPGGKGTQLAQAMRGKGLLVLNEKMPDRAKILLQNVERMGVENAVVTCADPESLAERLGGFFDKILVDAPCSGEGMLRKEPVAAENWSAANVEMCAARQKKILDSAAKMLAPGGALVYSTCTFAEEEDERNAEWFVSSHPEFALREQKKIYPHREKGEGHFAALFVKENEGEGDSRRARRDGIPPADKRAMALYRAFEKDFCKVPLEGRFACFGDSLCLLPEEIFDIRGLRVLRAGLQLGTAKNGRFEPAHAFAMREERSTFASVVSFDEEDILRYLGGAELPAKGARGWCVVAYNGYPVGLGKCGESIKNHLPKGLRR